MIKEEIRKVLDMNKSGAITDEQAAELLAELSRPAPDPEFSDKASEKSQARNKPGNGEGWWGNPFKEFLLGLTGGMAPTEFFENHTVSSRVEYPKGQDFIFKGNSFHMSSVTGLKLNASEVTGNGFHASKISDFRAENAKISDSKVIASALDDVSFEHGEAERLEIHASKVAELVLTGESLLRDFRLNASHIKNLKLDQASQWTDSSVSGAALSGFGFSNSQAKDIKLEGVKATDVRFEGSHINQLVMRGVKMKRVSLQACELEDTVISGGETWRWQGFADVDLIQCKFSKVLFSDCLLKDTVIRNVSVTNLKIRGLNLSGQVIDGDEAFRRAIQAHTA